MKRSFCCCLVLLVFAHACIKQKEQKAVVAVATSQNAVSLCATSILTASFIDDSLNSISGQDAATLRRLAEKMLSDTIKHPIGYFSFTIENRLCDGYVYLHSENGSGKGDMRWTELHFKYFDNWDIQRLTIHDIPMKPNLIDTQVVNSRLAKLDFLFGGYLTADYELSKQSDQSFQVILADSICQMAVFKFDLNFELKKVSHSVPRTESLPKRIHIKDGFAIGLLFRKEHLKEFQPKIYR